MGRISGWEDERVLEVDGGDESTTVWMYVMPLNYILKNGCSGKFGGMRSLPKLKKNLQWLPIMLSTAYKALCDQASAGHSHLLSFSHSLGPRCRALHSAPLACLHFPLRGFVLAAPLSRCRSLCTAGPHPLVSSYRSAL